MKDAGQSPSESDQTPDLQGGDAEDRIVAALAHLRGVQRAGGEAFGTYSFSREEESLKEWARGLGLLLEAEEILPKLERGGQEHDFYRDGDRVIKVTRHGVFGLSPGIELALVSSSKDARQFHLWEATPLQYLDRLALQNKLVPEINRLDGVILSPDGEMAIVTSQPAFDIVPVSQSEIDAWFESLGFRKITTAAYYREEDNLGIFDAHDKNLVRAGDTLVPFDVIPCHPDGGFLEFIEETLAAGHSLRAVRSSHTESD